MAKKGFIHHTRNLLVPHSGNDHHPHLFRIPGMIILLLAFVCFEVFMFAGFSFLKHTDRIRADVVSGTLVFETNEQRVKDSLPALTRNALLDQAAELKAEDMIANGYFAHFSPTGVSPWYWIQQTGYQYSSAGENLAIDFFDSKDVVNAWMNSPTHRANILKQKYTEIGIAVKEGQFNGAKRIFVVQFFGTPKDVAAIASKPATPVTPAVTPVAPVPTSVPTPVKTPIARPVVAGASLVASTSAQASTTASSTASTTPIETSVIVSSSTATSSASSSVQGAEIDLDQRGDSGAIMSFFAKLGSTPKRAIEMTLLGALLVVFMVSIYSFIFVREKIGKKFVMMLALAVLLIGLLIALNKIILLPDTSTPSAETTFIETE